MRSRKNKIFRDNVHGYISVPVDYVEKFIDTELFQRLRSIEQTGMRVLYPSARHDRFVHSLGVYHLGAKAFQCFKNNVSIDFKNYYDVKVDAEQNSQFWDRCQILFELACLLHDCAHTPFSHTLEFLYDVENLNQGNLNDKLKSYIGSSAFREDFCEQGGPHERMSALLVCSEFGKKVATLLDQYGLNNIEEESAEEFISRMIIGCKYNEKSAENSIKNCLISLLNSDSIDVDSLDYIIRDARMSGIDNMSIDVDRLLGSLTLVETTELRNVMLNGLDFSGNILKGELLAFSNDRASMVGKLCGSLQAHGPCSVSVTGTVSIDGNFKFLNQVEVKSGLLEKSIIVGGNEHEVIPNIKNETNISVLGELDQNLKIEGSFVRFLQDTDAQLDLKAQRVTFETAQISARFSGMFSGKLLGNHSEIPNAIIDCTLGFHKSSLSVIQNVVIARNYEYQWVYTHHKVVYYANYLLIELLRESVRALIKKTNLEKTGTPLDDNQIHATDCMARILSWKTMIQNSTEEPDCGPHEEFDMYFWRPSDADIQAVFRLAQVKATPEDKVYDLIQQYINRRYRKSLWKSYAEMCIFLDRFTQNEISEIFEMLVDQSKNVPKEARRRLQKQYGYLGEEWAVEFRKCGLDDVVWVNGDSKLKNLNPNETFIHFKNRDMTFGAISSPSNVKPMRSVNLFYLYYRPIDDTSSLKANKLTAFFRQKLKERRDEEKRRQTS